MDAPLRETHRRLVSEDPFDRILGRSRAADDIRSFGRRAASVDAPVLLLGESGTGKGVLARAIHDASPRARMPFVAVNCAAIPDALFESEFFGHVRGAFTGAQYAHKGLFEQAHGGTLFLDEVGELPLMAQAKLLTTIEDRIVRKVGGERTATVNTRIIAATASQLNAAVARAEFRRDLYHRLRVLHFTMPPLRERHGDITLLAGMFIERFTRAYSRSPMTVAPAVVDTIETWSWPGNIRELANTIEAAIVSSELDTIDSIPLDAQTAELSVLQERSFGKRSRYSFPGSDNDERELIQRALARCAGNKTRAAAELGMSRNTLLNKLRRTDRSA